MRLLDRIRQLFVSPPTRARDGWRTVAEARGLVFRADVERRYALGDRLEGVIGASHVTVHEEVDYDVQKIVGFVTVTTPGVPPSLTLTRAELVAWYRARRAVMPELPSIDDVAAPWVLGLRQGIGVAVEDGSLVYQQVYGIDDPATLGFVIDMVVDLSRQIARASDLDAPV